MLAHVHMIAHLDLFCSDAGPMLQVMLTLRYSETNGLSKMENPEIKMISKLMEFLNGSVRGTSSLCQECTTFHFDSMRRVTFSNAIFLSDDTFVIFLPLL
jgi:hypothetical protein